MQSPQKPKIALPGLLIAMILAIAVVWIKHEEAIPWGEQRLNLFKEVQSAKDELKNAELNHITYIITGAEPLHAAFVESVSRMDTHLEKTRMDQDLYERLQPLRAKIDGFVRQLKLSADVRKQQGEQAARPLLLTSRETDDIQAIDRALDDVELYEFNLLQLRVSEYTSIIDSVRWLVLTAGLLLCIVYLYMARSIQPALKGAEERNTQLHGELQAVRMQLDHMANVDFLTDCLNIKGLEHVFAIEQNRTLRVGATLVAVLINVDNFRRVNETYGPAIGDAILKEVSRRVIGILRPSDRIARVGPDEFLVLLTDTQLAYAMRVAERVRVTLAESPLRAGSDLIAVTASIGVAPLPLKLDSVEAVLVLTRSAMKRSKTGGKNRVSLARERGLSPEEEEPVARDIVEVLCDGAQFRTVYQPIVELATQEVNGYEIYTRGPDGAFESPAEFFRVCVENNILTAVDVLCLKLAIASVADVKASMRFHINVFPSTLLDVQIENLISLFPQDRPGKFCIELSEQQFVGDPAHLRDHVNALRQAGILVAIDDIGFGRSSLESLILLEPDIVKVDRKYVTGVAEDPAKQRLLRRVVNVGKSLGAEVVAEGIEVQDDLPVLREIGVHYGQGYYWGALLEFLPSDLNARPAVKSETR